MDLRALGDRNFLLGCILSFVTGIGMFATIYLTPLFLDYVRGYSHGRPAWQCLSLAWRPPRASQFT